MRKAKPIYQEISKRLVCESGGLVQQRALLSGLRQKFFISHGPPVKAADSLLLDLGADQRFIYASFMDHLGQPSPCRLNIFEVVHCRKACEQLIRYSH